MMIDDAIFETETAPEVASGGESRCWTRDWRTGPGAGSEPVATPSVPVRTYNVTVSLRDIPLIDALSLILRSRGLDYEIHPNVIWISTRDRIESVPLEPLETRIFDIQFGGPVRGQLRPQPLALPTITFGESQGTGGGGGGGGG